MLALSGLYMELSEPAMDLVLPQLTAKEEAASKIYYKIYIGIDSVEICSPEQSVRYVRVCFKLQRLEAHTVD